MTKKEEIIIHFKKHKVEALGNRLLNIYIDGNIVDTIKMGKIKKILVNHGIHSFCVANPTGCSSNDLCISISSESSVYIEVGTYWHDWRFLHCFSAFLAPINLFYAKLKSSES